MNTVHILIDNIDFSENGKIYLITNKTLGNRVILPLPNDKFIPFLETLFNELEMDDYEIVSRTLSHNDLKSKIVSILGDIFKSDYFDFAIDNQSSTQFFTNLDQLLINYIKTQELLVNFRQTSYISTDTVAEKPKTTKVEKNIQLPNREDTNFMINISTRRQIRNDIRPPTGVVKQNYLENNSETNEILSYNEFENFQTNIGSEISPFLEGTCTTQECMPVSYYTWRAEADGKTISTNEQKCSVLYCHSQYIGLVVENANVDLIPYLVQNFKDFELVKTYDTLSVSEINDVRTYFHKRDFETRDIIAGKIASFETLFDIQKGEEQFKDNFAIEMEYYIKDRYTIDTKPKNLMKASTILDDIILNLRPICNDKLKLSKELSAILLSMGLKKKRLADGIYYYGIVSKPLFTVSKDETEERFSKILNERSLKSAGNNKLESVNTQFKQLANQRKSKEYSQLSN